MPATIISCFPKRMPPSYVNEQTEPILSAAIKTFISIERPIFFNWMIATNRPFSKMGVKKEIKTKLVSGH